MEKAFGKTETNAQFFYELLGGESGAGLPDEQIDGALAQTLPDATPLAVPAANPADKSLQGHEVVAAAFNRITKYFPKIAEHFQALGLDMAAMLAPDGSVKPEFVAKVQARLAGKDAAAPKQALSYQAVQLYLAEKYQISTRDPAFAEKQKAFLDLPQAERDAALKTFFGDAQNVAKLTRWAFRYSEFSLLPFKDQVEALKQAGYDEATVKAELGKLWQGRSLPKVVAQAALLKGLELEEEAKALTGDAAQKKTQEARMLFRAAVELDNQNPLARRRLSTHLLREGKMEGASFHLAEAAKYETELRFLVEIVQGLQIGDKRLLAGKADAWGFVADSLVANKRYADAAALYHEAAKLATGQGDHAASLAFTERELRTDEAGKPYVLEFTEEQNPIAMALYKALVAQGVPSALLDRQGPGGADAPDRKINPLEIFAYLDAHRKEERVQLAFRSLNFPSLPWEAPGAKPPYADEAFDKLPLAGKLSAWHRYDAEQLKAKQPLDAAAVEKHLRIAALYEPNLPERHRAVGDFLMQQKSYAKAVTAYQAADQAAGFSDMTLKVALGHAFFGSGEFKKARDMYTVALEKTPKDVTLLKLRLETNQLYATKLDPAKDADAAKAVQAEIGADGAMLLALGSKAEKEKLAGLEKLLGALHDGDADKAKTLAGLAGLDPDQVGGISKKDAIAAMEGLAGNYLALADQVYADPKDAEMVRTELNALAAECFGVLQRYAEKDPDPAVQRMAKVYQASALFAQGKIDEAAETLKPVAKLPQAERILKAIENGRQRLINLAAVEAWEAYNKDLERAETDKAKGWISGTSVGSVEAKYKKEKAIAAAVKEKIQNGEAVTIEAALKLLKESGTEEIKERARYYLSTECRANGTGPIGDLIAYAALVPPSMSDAALIMQKAFDQEATKGAVESSFALYSIILAASPEPEMKKRAQSNMDALQGKAGFGRSVEKFFKMHDGEGLAIDVGLMFLAAGLGNLAKLRTLAKLEQAGVNGYKAVIIANAAGIGVEATALWGANTVKAAMLSDPSKVFSTEHLLKSYGSTLLMIGGLKGFGKLGETLGPRAAKGLNLIAEDGIALSKGGKVLVWGIGHASGLGGMIATSKTNQALGLTPKPVGGWKEGMVNDVFGYVQFAIAHKVADSVVKGKMTEVSGVLHKEVAYREALALARGNAEALGFKAERFEIKVGKDGAVTANGKPLDALPEETKRAVEAGLKKGKDDTVADQVVFLENPERKLLVGLFLEATLSRPGFSGGKLTKWLTGKDYAKANAYLKEFQLPLHFDGEGKLVAGEAGEPSPHEALGIQPPDTDGKGAEPAAGKPETTGAKSEKNKAAEASGEPVEVDPNDVILLEEGMTPAPQKLAARKSPPKSPPRDPKVEGSKVNPMASKALIPAALRRGLAVDVQGKSIEVDFSDAGLAFLDRNGTVSAATPGNKTPHVEIQMTVTEQGEVQFQVRAVAGEKLAVVDEAGKAREVTATYRPLREGEKLRVGGKEFTWFGPRSREGLALKAKVLTKFNGQILIEDVFKVDERAGWAEGFVKKWEQEFVGRESMFGDPARAFAERARKDPRLSDPEYRAAFATRCDNVLAALRPIVDKYSGETRSDLAFGFMRQVIDGRITLGDAKALAASVAAGSVVVEPVSPEQGKAYDYRMVPAYKGVPIPKDGAMVEGLQGAVALEFSRTVYQVAKLGDGVLQFRQGRARNGEIPPYYVANRSAKVPFSIYDVPSGKFVPVEGKEETAIADGTVMRIGEQTVVFRSIEALQKETAARNEILAEREVLSLKRAELLSQPDSTRGKAQEVERLAKLEKDFRDKLQETGRDADGVLWLDKEVTQLALGDSPFAVPARQLLAGKIDVKQYHASQLELGKQLVVDHTPALQEVKDFLSDLEKNPELEYRLAGTGKVGGKKTLDNPHYRLKDPADIASKLARRGWTDLAPLTDVAGARIVVRTTNDAMHVVEAIEKQFKVRNQMAADGTIELEIIGESAKDNSEIMFVTAKPDKDHPDRLSIGTSTGYRALHVVVEVNGHPVEIQIQTEAIFRWGKIQHSLVYKNKQLPHETFEELNRFCREAAKYLTDLESGPKPDQRPATPLIPKSLPADLRASLAADIRKMGELMDHFEALAEDPSHHNTQVFKRPPSIPPAGEGAKAPAVEPSDKAVTGADSPKAKGDGRIPQRRAMAQALAQPVALPELGAKPPAKPAPAVEMAYLRTPDGEVLRLPAGKKAVTLGSKEGGADIVLGQMKKGSAPLHAEILQGPDGKRYLRPLDGQEVQVWDGQAWRKLGTEGKGESYPLRVGDRIKVGDWEMRWQVDKLPPLPRRGAKPPPLPSVKGVLPTYEQVSYRAEGLSREITHLVEVSDATVSGESESWHSSTVNSFIPERSHAPLYGRWHHLTEAEYQEARSAGTLQDTPPHSYEVTVVGAQRLADVQARLQAQYGSRLSPLPRDIDGSITWLLRNEQGEAQVKITLKPKPVSVPSAADAKARYATFTKNYLPVLEEWAGENATSRSFYGFRILELIGVEYGARGERRFGTRFEGLLARMEGGKTPADRARAGEELATMLAYLYDVPTFILEHRVLHLAKQVIDESPATKAIVYALRQTGSLRLQGEAAEQALRQVRALSDKARVLGEELRSHVEPKEQKAGHPVFDEYVAALKGVQQAVKKITDLKKALEAQGVDLEKEVPSPDWEKEFAKEAKEVEDDMIEEVSDESPPVKKRDLHGAEDQPMRDLRDFTDQELESLEAIGVTETQGLRHPKDPNFAQKLVNALDHLLKHPFKSREYESGVVRLVGALRHWELFNGKKMSWLDGYLRGYGRSGYGIPLASVPPPSPPPERLPLSADEQRSLGVREINPHNVMTVVAVIRKRSTPMEKIGDFMPFHPGGEDRRMLRRIMDNYGSVVLVANPKLGAYLEAMFKPSEAYAAVMDVKEPADDGKKLPERRDAGAAVVSAVEPRLGDPTGAYVENIPANSWVGKELKSFARACPSLVAEIPGLTPALERIFDRGGRVEKWPSGHVLVETPSGAETRVTRPATPNEVLAYLRWYQRRGFGRVTTVQAQAAWNQLSRRAAELGVELVLGEVGRPEGKKLQEFLNENGAQVAFLNQLLQLLPASLIKAGRLNRIHLKTPRQEDAFFGAYDASDGSLYLYSGGFTGSRRNLAGLFLHELGHPTAVRYHADGSGDPLIPPAVRAKMQSSHALLAKQKALFGLDWAAGEDARLKKQAKDSDEFLADLHLAYVAAGPKLRAFIRSFPEGTAERQAWDFVYGELRDRVFGGLEYDFLNLPPPPKPSLKVLPGGKLEVPPAPLQVPDAFLQTEIGPHNAVKELRLGGLAAGRDPGIGYSAHNEDRFAVTALRGADGKKILRFFAIDGMGGHEGGEFAAALSEYALAQRSQYATVSLEGAIQTADQLMVQHPEYRRLHGEPGSVVVGVEVKELDNDRYDVTFADVGDAEAMLFQPDFQLQPGAYTAKEPLGTAKLPRGQTFLARINPYARMVDQALGGHYRDGKKGLEVSVETHRAKKGSIVVAGSDGLLENFNSKDEMGDVLRSSGARNAAEMELALRNETLIRMHILHRFKAEKRFGQAITHEDFVAAYREVWKQNPPAGTWRYEGMLLLGKGKVVDPTVDPNRDGEQAYYVGHFKADNVVAVVHVLGEALGEGAAAPRADFLPPPLPRLPASPDGSVAAKGNPR